MLKIPAFIWNQFCHFTPPHYEDYAFSITLVVQNITSINNLWC